jgi:hypothetical protein
MSDKPNTAALRTLWHVGCIQARAGAPGYGYLTASGYAVSTPIYGGAPLPGGNRLFRITPKGKAAAEALFMKE